MQPGSPQVVLHRAGRPLHEETGGLLLLHNPRDLALALRLAACSPRVSGVGLASHGEWAGRARWVRFARWIFWRIRPFELAFGRRPQVGDGRSIRLFHPLTAATSCTGAGRGRLDRLWADLSRRIADSITHDLRDQSATRFNRLHLGVLRARPRCRGHHTYPGRQTAVAGGCSDPWAVALVSTGGDT
jgi:hypothetical protein